mmetsp:Transcript_57509/g.115450  ORF Transcript_57509/g.115450 Transcript_57509/m.115450 type:complete len:222 (+) Transcript_57509:194-859(+)
MAAFNRSRHKKADDNGGDSYNATPQVKTAKKMFEANWTLNLSAMPNQSPTNPHPMAFKTLILFMVIVAKDMAPHYLLLLEKVLGWSAKKVGGYIDSIKKQVQYIAVKTLLAEGAPGARRLAIEIACGDGILGVHNGLVHDIFDGSVQIEGGWSNALSVKTHVSTYYETEKPIDQGVLKENTQVRIHPFMISFFLPSLHFLSPIHSCSFSLASSSWFKKSKK